VTFAIALFLSIVLLLIAGLHAFWGLRGVWPAQDERSLALMVVGTKDIERMPSSIACFVVAAILIGSAIWPFVIIEAIVPPWPRWLSLTGSIALCAVFLGRGGISFIPALRWLAPEEPFATLDRRFYGPLCMIIGLLFTILVMRHWT
jgi:hypothetical protein